MAEYSVFFRRSAVRELHKIPKRDLRRILGRVESLSREPRPPRHEKLAGQERYRIRQGDYRIICSVQDDERTVWIVRVGHRRDIYEKLTRG